MALRPIINIKYYFGTLSNKNVSYKFIESSKKGSRTLFFDATTNPGNSRRFAEKKLVGFSPEQMFDVVVDVGNYYKFLPFCKKSFTYDFREDGRFKSDLVIGFPPLTERYTSNVTSERPGIVKSECFDGVMFNYLLTIWKFNPGLKDIEQSCVIDFYIDFQFKSALHMRLSNLVFDTLVRQMEQAFFAEARVRYGRPSIKSHVLVSGN
uniref:CSON012999 protein n=1 Tax=Culicoides sonorensis TaxID=179676 RepID=A0A336LMW5_CULSO